MDWLDARPGIDLDMSFGTHYYDYTKRRTMDRVGGGQRIDLTSRVLLLVAIAFLFVGIATVVLLLPTLY